MKVCLFDTRENKYEWIIVITIAAATLLMAVSGPALIKIAKSINSKVKFS